MRPTLLSTLLGLLALALSGPMTLLATVGGDSCKDTAGVEMRCAELLVDGDFWLDVGASAVSSIAGPWQDLSFLLLPMFGIPVFMEQVRKRKTEEQSNAANPPGA